MMFLLGVKDQRAPMQDGLQDVIAALRTVQKKAKSCTSSPIGPSEERHHQRRLGFRVG